MRACDASKKAEVRPVRPASLYDHTLIPRERGGRDEEREAEERAGFSEERTAEVPVDVLITSDSAQAASDPWSATAQFANGDLDQVE